MSQGTTKGVPIDIDPTLAANSDQLVASQRATKTYVDAQTGVVNPTNSTDSTMFLAVLDSATGNQQLKSSTLATYNGTTGHITSKMILNAGGTAAGSAALYATAGSLLSTIEAGAVERDSTSFYITNSEEIGREVLYSYAQADATNVSGIGTVATDIFTSKPIQLYDGADNEVLIDVVYSVSGSAAAVTFDFINTVACASNAWHTRMVHSQASGIPALTDGSKTTLGVSDLLPSKDFRANASISTMSAQITPSSTGTFRAKFDMIIQPSVSTLSAEMTPKISIAAGGTIAVSGVSSWKSRRIVQSV